MLCHGILNSKKQNNIYINHIYALSWNFKQQETKCGVEPNETILKTSMIHGLEAMCDVHEAIEYLICFIYSCSRHTYSTI